MGWHVKVDKESMHWTLSCRIPWSNFGSPPRKGTTWKFNVARERYAGNAHGENSAAYLLLQGFHEKERFWPMIFE